ncbi:unnamed protein product [Phytophthora lilii]|uniref:Unnamed protein product n=1 Tax=Phytophthora lilii TaxID=2077276 RepID=A0A9W6WZ67_9STRA|nr:unnamed protein product [Phytophthora lilii]
MGPHPIRQLHLSGAGQVDHVQHPHGKPYQHAPARNAHKHGDDEESRVLLGSANYFHWEYNMRMTLARKGLLAHVEVVKSENEITEAWLVSDAQELGIIAQGVELQHQTKIRAATRAMQACNTLREYYYRTTLHNRVTMTRRLHEFKMEDESTMSKHLDAFDELVVGLQTLGEPVDEARQLVVLQSAVGVQADYIDCRECQGPFKANAGRSKGGQRNGRKGNGPWKNGSRFKGKCFKCNQTGHMKHDCPDRNGDHDEEAVFAVSEERSTGWLIDSGATAHMTPTYSIMSVYRLPSM